MRETAGVPDRRLDVLSVRWYEQRTAPPIAPRWLAAARAHLPEALPRRFGDTEPLRGRFDDDAAFVAAGAAATGLFFLSCHPPVHGVSLAASPMIARWGPVQSHHLSVETEPDDARVRAFAEALVVPETLYVSASVERDVLLSRRTLVHDGPSTDEPHLAPLGNWLGLPPTPPVWHVFGRAYARVPLRDGWVPEEYRARLDEIDPSQRHARRMPRGLRRPWWSALFG
jgi:hypothetical protein